MNGLNAHRLACEIERDRAKERMEECRTNGATLEEYRMRQREYEQLEHRLIWFDMAPDGWFV